MNKLYIYLIGQTWVVSVFTLYIWLSWQLELSIYRLQMHRYLRFRTCTSLRLLSNYTHVYILQCVILLVMVTESITVIIRRTSHFRVTRALRPLFLLDTYYCRGIRRYGWSWISMSQCNTAKQKVKDLLCLPKPLVIMWTSWHDWSDLVLVIWHAFSVHCHKPSFLMTNVLMDVCCFTVSNVSFFVKLAGDKTLLLDNEYIGNFNTKPKHNRYKWNIQPVEL